MAAIMLTRSPADGAASGTGSESRGQSGDIVLGTHRVRPG
jgi:hypothetical protein